jgi:hypothetical protein
MNLRSAQCYLFLIFFIFPSFLSCATHNGIKQHDNRVHHVILFWLNDPGDQSIIELISNSSISFTEIPGVQEVVVGTTFPSDRDIVDDSFDVAAILIFENEQAYRNYLTHPQHLKAIKEIIKPHVRKIHIYNISNNP